MSELENNQEILDILKGISNNSQKLVENSLHTKQCEADIKNILDGINSDVQVNNSDVQVNNSDVDELLGTNVIESLPDPIVDLQVAEDVSSILEHIDEKLQNIFKEVQFYTRKNCHNRLKITSNLFELDHILERGELCQYVLATYNPNLDEDHLNNFTKLALLNWKNSKNIQSDSIEKLKVLFKSELEQTSRIDLLHLYKDVVNNVIESYFKDKGVDIEHQYQEKFKTDINLRRDVILMDLIQEVPHEKIVEGMLKHNFVGKGLSTLINEIKLYKSKLALLFIEGLLNTKKLSSQSLQFISDEFKGSDDIKKLISVHSKVLFATITNSASDNTLESNNSCKLRRFSRKKRRLRRSNP